MNTDPWREQALHQLDVLDAKADALADVGHTDTAAYRVRIAELRLVVEQVAHQRAQ